MVVAICTQMLDVAVVNTCKAYRNGHYEDNVIIGCREKAVLAYLNRKSVSTPKCSGHHGSKLLGSSVSTEMKFHLRDHLCTKVCTVQQTEDRDLQME